MRATSFAIVTAFCTVISACGDNEATKVDAPPVDVVTGPKCSDGIDNDGDGRTDYPSDPGCFAPNQDDEVDDCPTGPNCPQCANGVDDDGNGKIDYPDDSGCTAASDQFEFVNNPVACGAGLIIKQLPSNGMDTGTLDAAMSMSAIGSTCGGGGGVAAYAYQISLTDPKVLVATTVGSTMDTVLDLRGSNCTTTAIECNDKAVGPERRLCGVQPVGRKKPTRQGIHDLLGNVAEWVHDRAGNYGSGPVQDPLGPAEGILRVARGCSWDCLPAVATPSQRLIVPADKQTARIGVRLARTARP